ncbi:MAG: DNA polymerase II [Acidilobaceae archaeon]|nr:DNA polymerase II [Acidilobaceae archaeon]MDW7974350.1 DNA polymerase II [Sulfolobales archaeon]
MEVTFQLLDVSYELVGKEPRILMLSRLSDGRRATICYDGFKPYFYVLAEEPQKVASEIYALSRASSPIISVEEVERRYFGRPVRPLKVTTLVPGSVRDYREEVKEIPGVQEVLEADIRFSMRFLIDMNLYPMRWYTAKVEEIQDHYGTDAAFLVRGQIEEDASRANLDPLEGLRVLAFDIEVFNEQRTPDPKRDPVIMIGLMSSEGELKILESEDDRQLIAGFAEEVRRLNPDIIVGYNQNRFDWPYLIERAKVLGLELGVGRRGEEPQSGAYGHYSVPGRLNVDLLDFAFGIGEVKVKSLDEVADYLGVMPKEKRVLLEWWQIGEYWKDKAKREVLRKYLEHDVISTMGLAQKFLPFGAQMSQISGLPLDQVMSASTGYRLEWRLMREAFKRGELVPNRVERGEESYEGAIVLEPRPGVHENVAVLDFASMYPSIMVKYNVGPDTRGEGYTAPEVGHSFRREPPGFFKEVLERFLRWRREIRRAMEGLQKGSPEYRLLDERQKAIKILANASYGYLGWPSARWYCRECAEAVTAWGRNLIKTAIAKARELGIEVIYGDTDSLFVRNSERVAQLVAFVEKELGFDIKVDKVYRKVFFTEAKKRYVGLTQDGKIDVAGFEAVRGDWSELAKEAQAAVAELVLKTGRVEEAVEYVKEMGRKVKEGKVSIDKLVIWKTITRRLSEYKAEQAHVTAAKIMVKQGIKVEPGTKVGYVIAKGSGPLYTRARPYFMASWEEVDREYYVEKQLIPAAMRILGYFGVKESQLLPRRTLKDFF